MCNVFGCFVRYKEAQVFEGDHDFPKFSVVPFIVNRSVGRLIGIKVSFMCVKKFAVPEP